MSAQLCQWCRRPLDESDSCFTGSTAHVAERAARPFTVKRIDLFGNVRDTFQTETELNGFRPTQGRMI